MNQKIAESHDGPPVRYEWHPVIQAILWLANWLIFAVSTSIVWEFLTKPELLVNTVVARGISIFIAIISMTFVIFLIDMGGSVAQHAWDRYDMQFARKIYAAVFVVFLLVAIPYVSLVAWLLNKLWPPILRWCVSSLPHPKEAVDVAHSWLTWLCLSLICVAITWLVFVSFLRNPFYSYRGAIRVLGVRKTLLGIILTAYLRLLVPRRDLFVQAPVVSWMFPYALLVLLYHYIPIDLFAGIIPLLLLAILVPMQVDLIAPPQWLFLGSSDFESFGSFYNLRMRWKRHGINLLDRESSGGLKFYEMWRAQKNQNWKLTDPTIARVWSLRTRPAVWQTAVRLLATFVPVVIVDRRRPSPIVDYEVDWLVSRGHEGKTYLLVSLQPSPSHRPTDKLFQHFDEENLLDAEWNDSGLNITRNNTRLDGDPRTQED